MPRVVFKDTVIALCDDTILLEGHHYFPPDTVRMEYLKPSETRTVCHWKGTAHYYHLVVGDDMLEDAAWSYPEPSQPARAIRGHIAFGRGVLVLP